MSFSHYKFFPKKKVSGAKNFSFGCGTLGLLRNRKMFLEQRRCEVWFDLGDRRSGLVQVVSSAVGVSSGVAANIKSWLRLPTASTTTSV